MKIFICTMCGCEVDSTEVIVCAGCGIALCDNCVYDSPEAALEYLCEDCLENTGENPENLQPVGSK